jgi:hypothetical protein
MTRAERALECGGHPGARERFVRHDASHGMRDDEHVIGDRAAETERHFVDELVEALFESDADAGGIPWVAQIDGHIAELPGDDVGEPQQRPRQPLRKERAEA